MDAIEPVGPADLGSCLALSDEARWNQSGDDWMHILTHGECCGIRHSGRLAATGAVLPYGSLFGWICMILVAAGHRRRGLATRLMRHLVEGLLSRGLIPGLDATAAGRGVYLGLGFRDVYPIGRLWAPGRPAGLAAGADGFAIEPLASVDAQLLAVDDACFGADRAPLLGSLVSRDPQLATVVRNGDRIAGFSLGRRGRNATQIGPVVAESQETALALIAASLRAAAPGPVLIDVPDHQHALSSRLLSSGFERQRGYTRMLYQRDEPIGDPTRTMAIAGPELA